MGEAPDQGTDADWSVEAGERRAEAVRAPAAEGQMVDVLARDIELVRVLVEARVIVRGGAASAPRRRAAWLLFLRKPARKGPALFEAGIAVSRTDAIAVMASATASVRVLDGGTRVIPARFRKAMGLKPGDAVVMGIEDAELRIATRLSGMLRARVLVRPRVAGTPSMADEFIAGRRAEGGGRWREPYTMRPAATASPQAEPPAPTITTILAEGAYAISAVNLAVVVSRLADREHWSRPLWTWSMPRGWKSTGSRSATLSLLACCSAARRRGPSPGTPLGTTDRVREGLLTSMDVMVVGGARPGAQG